MAMSKRSTFTTISPLPAGIKSREVVVAFLHNHVEMIDLNPLVIERHPIDPPAHAPDEERGCAWWSLTDKISYLPGGVVSGDVTYTAAFHDLPDGIQTHVYAPMGTDIRERWSLGGTLPGEPPEPVELGIGAPRQGLYLREDVELRCNFVMSSFIKRTLKKAHGVLVDRLVASAAATHRQSAAGPQRVDSSLSAASATGYPAPQDLQPTAPYHHPQQQNQQHQQQQQQQQSSRPGSTSFTPPPGSHPAPYGHAPSHSVGSNSSHSHSHNNRNSNSYAPEPLRVNKSRSSSGQYYQQQQHPQGSVSRHHHQAAPGAGNSGFPAELE
ncbi:uncharacterized protein F4812DRAFT_270886 [Daldinia caldariorum]|uniref:uncharacterized protein n=1 Tax=Daldinia caldariorum TaxID=326644 RepID=UPI002008185E|nr:uncharacterized protein F4812DRAFT_270886 [Daldinia caldariorum]KAI1470581.1 hypothetical protein F4812DRAFT_270886 [Daldinia caldariorum]